MYMALSLLTTATAICPGPCEAALGPPMVMAGMVSQLLHRFTGSKVRNHNWLEERRMKAWRLPEPAEAIAGGNVVTPPIEPQPVNMSWSSQPRKVEVRVCREKSPQTPLLLTPVSIGPLSSVEKPLV